MLEPLKKELEKWADDMDLGKCVIKCNNTVDFFSSAAGPRSMGTVSLPVALASSAVIAVAISLYWS
jgi:hypothetical protein